jgi:hypothetical protein
MCELQFDMPRSGQLKQRDVNGNPIYDIFFEVRRLAVGGRNREPKLCMVKRPIMDACRQRAQLAAEHPRITSQWVYPLHIRNTMPRGYRGGHAFSSGRFIRHRGLANQGPPGGPGLGLNTHRPPSDELDSVGSFSVHSSSTETNSA